MLNWKRTVLLLTIPLLLVSCVQSRSARRTSVIKLTPVNFDREFFRGPRGAQVTLIEYSDFECGFCRKHHATVDRLLKAYPRRLNFVYRHYPLKSHVNARPAALAAECAGELGGKQVFWRYVDVLFSDGPEKTAHGEYANLLGLNASAFRACVESNRHDAKIDADIRSGNGAGLRGTPFNLLVHNPSGKIRIVEGAYPFEHFKKNIDALLNGGRSNGGR